MLRYEKLEDISDGRLYTENDMVRADTRGCQGCSKCCESDMGNTIILDPYDMARLEQGTGKTFDELLTGFYIELSMADGIVLPNLKMQKGCRFLREGRCSIHPYRPGICRMFPLGRIYTGENEFQYILQTGECAVTDRAKIKVRKWIGLGPDREAYRQFVLRWHRFLNFERKKVREAETRFREAENREDYDPAEEEKKIMKTVLEWFYLDTWPAEDFYGEFEARIRGCTKALLDLSRA